MKAFMGTEVSVEVVDCYRSEVIKNQPVNAAVHVDGDHRTSAKLLIYLQDVNSTNDGPLAILNNQGVLTECLGLGGTGTFFFASRESHAGIGSTERPRYCLNIKFYPTMLSSNIKEGSFFVNKMANLLRI
jgi:hypothetical protein